MKSDQNQYLLLTAFLSFTIGAAIYSFSWQVAEIVMLILAVVFATSACIRLFHA